MVLGPFGGRGLGGRGDVGVAGGRVGLHAWGRFAVSRVSTVLCAIAGSVPFLTCPSLIAVTDIRRLRSALLNSFFAMGVSGSG